MPELYEFQKQAVEALQQPHKHIVIATMGCLAKGTPVRMADGTTKPIEQVKAGDILLAYDQDNNVLTGNEVNSVIRTSHKPKPMIELEYDREKITTTYDHYFWGGDGFYPLYQLIWGALETSQRVQLELLCEQYGQALDHETVWRKHSSSNEACSRPRRLLSHNDRWQNYKTPQNCGADLAGQSLEPTLCKPFELQQGGQSSREPRVVQSQVQCLVGNSSRNNGQAHRPKQYNVNPTGQRSCQSLFLTEYGGANKSRKSEALRYSTAEVPKCETNNDYDLGEWKFEIKVSEPYYTISMRTAPYSYCIGQRHCYLTHNSGKSAISLTWAESTHKPRVLVVTTASARDSGQWFNELSLWCKSLSSSALTVISWEALAKWTISNWNSLHDYVFVFDEVAKGKSGVSSNRGRAFLQITKQTDCWAGFTATPGDRWIDFHAYFIAGGYIKNKTQFTREFCQVQTFKGYPEIVGYREEDTLKRWWEHIAVVPDTSQMQAEMPAEQHFTYEFKPDPYYFKLLKTRTNKQGDFLDTAGALAAECRRLCFGKGKHQWLADYLENLGTNTVIFYALTETGDKICEIAKRALPKGAKIWRICGGQHDIPTEETIGKYDIVVCQWQAGSEALNLQFMHEWVSAEPCYSYSTSQQARGRIKRIGQQHNMVFRYLMCPKTIEENIYKALKNKGEFAADIWYAELQERNN